MFAHRKFQPEDRGAVVGVVSGRVRGEGTSEEAGAGELEGLVIRGLTLTSVV